MPQIVLCIVEDCEVKSLQLLKTFIIELLISFTKLVYPHKKTLPEYLILVFFHCNFPNHLNK